MDNIVAGYLAAFGRVVVLAVRVCPLTGPAAREARVTSRLALQPCQRRKTYNKSQTIMVLEEPWAVVEGYLPCGSDNRPSGYAQCGPGRLRLPRRGGKPLPSWSASPLRLEEGAARQKAVHGRDAVLIRRRSGWAGSTTRGSSQSSPTVVDSTALARPALLK